MTNEIQLDKAALDEFTGWLVDRYNEDVYDQLKDYLSPYDNCSQAMDYFCQNLHGLICWDGDMTEYEVRYLDNKHIPHGFVVLARDVTHAITQFQELNPGMHMTSVLPADQWTKDENSSD